MHLKAFTGLAWLNLLIVVIMPGIPDARMTASHALSIALIPDQAKLAGHDRIRIHDVAKPHLELMLSPRARIRAVQLNGQNHEFRLDQGRVTVPINPAAWQAKVDIDIDYTCRFDDPAPRRPLNTDNPGYGVSGTISPQGAFILSGAGWYPKIAGAGESYDLRVEGPLGIIAVTTGRQMGITSDRERTVSRWLIDKPVEGMSLSAGPYVVERKTARGFTAATYLLTGNQALSSRYLDMSLTYLKKYSTLFGPYPFGAFSVVENFFPTGYGFPGYTLMGGAILRLPFIPLTSLPHEIVHNWWGNGVLVAPSSGNWCEGLTTYAADYLIKEDHDPEAAMDYRRQTMRNFAALVPETVDFPLSRFRSRFDPVTKAIGYDKSAMVFHMLRRRIGDKAFWDALRDFYDQFLFEPASWQDLQKVFEKQSSQSLEAFFNQWVYRAGAPSMRFENLRLSGDNAAGYTITGQVIQNKPYFSAPLQMVVETDHGRIRKPVPVSGRRTEFSIASVHTPKRIIADPDYHLFRRLAVDEIPPTVNDLKGSTNLSIVPARRLGRAGDVVARQLARTMGTGSFDIISEDDLKAADRPVQNLLFIGLPEHIRIGSWFPADVQLTARSFSLAEKHFEQPTDVLFCVVRHPRDPGKIVAILHPLSLAAAEAVIYKLSHYGRYSFLAFSNGHNRVKGTWDVTASPLLVRFETETMLEKNGEQP